MLVIAPTLAAPPPTTQLRRKDFAIAWLRLQQRQNKRTPIVTYLIEPHVLIGIDPSPSPPLFFSFPLRRPIVKFDSKASYVSSG
jgi:hypothetical protein